MPNKYTLNIAHVDGESGYWIQTKSADEAFKFLERLDHEGSGVSMTAEVEDADDVYHILEEQAHREANRG